MASRYATNGGASNTVTMTAEPNIRSKDFRLRQRLGPDTPYRDDPVSTISNSTSARQ
jgi:hypothetical protein